MKFFLCDDEPEILELYSNKIRVLCKKHQIDCEIICYRDGEQLVFDYDKKTFTGSVLFLDIRMPRMDGFSTVQALDRSGYKGEIIFLTNSRQHLLSAFDVGAFNYIIKGETSDGRFEKVFLKAVKAATGIGMEYILFSAAGENRNLAVRDIRYFEVDKRIITVSYNDEQFSFFSTITKLENLLFGRGFVRVHRAFLVAVTQIVSLTSTELTLRDGTKLPVGRKYFQGVKEALANLPDLIKDEPAKVSN